MLPGIYEFTWDAGHIIFLGAFYTVLTIVFATLIIGTTRAIRAMRAERLLSVRSIDRAPPRTLARAIRSSGYYNIKATRLKQFTRFLLAHYGGSLQRMFRADLWSLRKELLSVSGVGEETADSILLYAGGRPIFVVDAYTRRVLERHRLISEGSRYG